MLRLIALLLALLAPLAGSAQTNRTAAQTLLEEGLAAYAGNAHAEALRAFERAAGLAPDDAEIRYHLARILFDARSSVRDERRAGREIAAARRLDPGNVLYMVAELHQLRTDASNFFQEITRARRRVVLAQRILAVDPDNAFAHEELGTAHIRDYWQYRNAVVLPGAAFYSPTSAFGDEREDPGLGVLGDNTTDPDFEEQTMRQEGVALLPESRALGAAEIPAGADRFDLEGLRAQGAPVVSLARRAERAYARAIGHLEASLRRDPRRRSVYDQFMRLAVLSGDFASVLPALAQMQVYFPDDPATHRFAGLAAVRVGQWEAAEAAFQDALARMDAADRDAFEDLTLILPEHEHSAFRADPEGFAARYWTARDPRFLNAVNERRLEHYARLTAADLLYRSDDLGLPGWRTPRGQVHVRYGLPRTDVVVEGSFARLVEAFGDRDAAFAGSATAAEANRFNVWDYGDFRFVFEDPFRNGEFRLYSPPADLFALAPARGLDRMDYAARARETFRRTPERYQFTTPGRTVELPYRVTAFRGQSGLADLYVHFGIPLAPEAADGRDVDLNVRTGTFLVSSERDLLVERRRTLFGLRADQVLAFDGLALWASTETLTAPPGRHEVSLEFETVSGGASAVQRRAVDVPAFTGAGLQLSDLMLAYMVEEDVPAGPGLVRRGGFTIRPVPWGVFGADDPVYLYFEVYNLGQRDGRTDYEVEARLVPADDARGLARAARRALGRRARGVSTTFLVRDTRPDDAQYVVLDAAGQAPGRYTLTLRVRDRVSGQAAERQTELLLE
ncbi:MAG: GWxTD domain-containing protein [Rubricoccaceae bacterium]